jgi:thiazole synthase
MLTIDGHQIDTPLFLGTSQYPSLETLQQCIQSSQTQVVTVSLRRSQAHAPLSPPNSLSSLNSPQKSSENSFWKAIQSHAVHLLPNTAGCTTVKEAVETAHMARDLFDTRWIKLEVIGNSYTLQSDPLQLYEAAKILHGEGFFVFPYMTDDLVLADRLLSLGLKVLMPWGSPIGSGRGLMNHYNLQMMREHFKEAIIIIDAGIGRPSDACQAMEMGMDGVLLNTAVARSLNPVAMAGAFTAAVRAGQIAYQSGIMEKRISAAPSTPELGRPFQM